MQNSNDYRFERLREIAEDLLKGKETAEDNPGGEINRILHELRVHQVELNIQNEELQRAQFELEASKQELSDLFDYAPVAYFVINENGIIIQANLTSVAKFGTTRKGLIGTPLSVLIAAKDRDKFYLHYKDLIEELKPKFLEVWFVHENIAPFYGKMESVVVNQEAAAKTFRVAITDITERKIYEERLETIHQLDRFILKRSSMPSVIERVIDELWRVSGSDYIAIILLKGGENSPHFFIRDNLQDATRRLGKIIDLKGEFIDSLEVSKWDDGAPQIVHNPSFLPRETLGAYPHHFIVPITAENSVMGIIDLGSSHAEDFTTISPDFVQQLAVQLGIAIQQADFLERIEQYTTSLETMVEERTSQLLESQKSERQHRLFAEGMLSIVKKINQSLEIEHVLEQILINLENIVTFDGAQIVISDQKTGDMIVQSRGNVQLNDELSDSIVAIDRNPIYIKMARTGEPVSIPKNAQSSLESGPPVNIPIESYLGTPIQSGRQLMGFIDLYGLKTNAFDREDIAHLQAFAEQASIAVKNARLYQKGQELAAMEERQRLARELHDAVSQLIFSLSIMAESLPKLVQDQQYEKAKDVSESMQMIATSAHAEMRLLLLELRPMSFERIRLDELLRQLANASLGRYSPLAFEVKTQKTPQISIDVKNNLFRIAQEAINNIGKHANASKIRIDLWVDQEGLHLMVEDDGRGFDTDNIASGYGLTIMQERAQSIGAQFNIVSQAGEGTRIQIDYPL